MALVVTKDADGWTDLSAFVQADSRVAYVSSTDGDDGTGAAVDASGITDVFNPSGAENPTPFATPAAGYAALRTGYADFLLLKRGDSWSIDDSNDIVWTLNGPSPSAPHVIAAYGPVSSPMPRLDNSYRFIGGFVTEAIPTWENRVLAHLHFKGVSPETQGSTSYGCISLLRFVSSPEGWIRNFLFEGCYFEQQNRFPIAIQDQSESERLLDIHFRRNVFNDTYGGSTDGLAYCYGYKGLVWEENVFVESGVRCNEEFVGNLTQPPHVLYLQDGSGPALDTVTVRRNIFLEDAAYSVQMRSGGTHVENLHVRSPMNIAAFGSLGTSGDPGPVDAGYAARNVVVQARDMPGDKGSRGWGMGVQNIDATIEDNIFATNIADATNTQGVNLDNLGPLQTVAGHVQFLDNVFYNFADRNIQMQVNDGLLTAYIDGNVLYESVYTTLPKGGAMLVRSRESVAAENDNYTFGTNYYYSAAPETDWFEWAPVVTSLAEFLTATGDAGGLQETDPWIRETGVTIEDFISNTGVAADYSAWKAALTTQRKGNWDPNLMALNAINWFRSGFGKSTLVDSPTSSSFTSPASQPSSAYILFGG